jgi:hypothetical protein
MGKHPLPPLPGHRDPKNWLPSNRESCATRRPMPRLPSTAPRHLGQIQRPRRRTRTSVALNFGGDMQTPMCKRVSENAPGDFYVEAGCCVRCCLPHGEAPELMNDPSVDFRGCYFRRQPEDAKEIEHAIQAIRISEVACLRYGGTNQAILQRLHQLGKGRACDHSATPEASG